jgi:hypothetical protein
MSQYSVKTSTANSGIKFKDFSLDCGMKNGIINLVNFYDTPVLVYKKSNNGNGKVTYTSSIPSDYSNFDINVRIFWSASSDFVENVRWKFKYKVLPNDTPIENITANLTIFDQETNGISDTLVDTGSGFKISKNDIINGKMIIFSIERDGSLFDTYNDIVRIHLVRLEYT